MRGGILDCRCARRSARRQVGTKGWSYSDRTKGWALELNSTALAYHVQFAELDAHNSFHAWTCSWSVGSRPKVVSRTCPFLAARNAAAGDRGMRKFKPAATFQQPR